MDLHAMDTQLQRLVVENSSFLDGVSSLRKEILSLEELENSWLGSLDTTALEAKVNELNVMKVKFQEMLSALIDEEKQLFDYLTQQAESNLLDELENCIGREKAANKARAECLKKKVRIEQDFRYLLTKKLHDLTSMVVNLKIMDFQRDANRFTPSTYVSARLKAKRADMDRMYKQRTRFEKAKASATKHSQNPDDDLSSLASESCTDSEADFPITPVSKLLQRNVALTLEKQKLMNELQFEAETQNKLKERMDTSEGNLQELYEKLESYSFVKEEIKLLEEAQQVADAEITKYTAEVTALQNIVDANNKEIHNAKNSIIQLQKQISDRGACGEKSQVEVQSLEDELNQVTEELQKRAQLVNEKENENRLLAEQNKKLRTQVEQKQSTFEMAVNLKAKNEKDEDEILELRRKIKQLNHDLQIKQANIRAVVEAEKDLDQEIADVGLELKYLREKLENSRKERALMDDDDLKIKTETKELEELISSKNIEKLELEKRIAPLKESLKLKESEMERVQEELRVLQQDNEMARKFLQELTDAKLAAQEMEQQKEAEEGVLQKLCSWISLK